METIDTKICEELWKQYEPRLWAMCRIKLQSMPDEIDDVISEVFLALCKKIDESGPPENPKTWLYKTLYNRIAKKYNDAYKARERLSDLTAFENSLPSGTDCVEEVEDCVLFEHLDCVCKDKLKDKEKTLMKYFFEDGLTTKEIANILHISEFTVRQRCHRLCVHLRKIADKIMRKKHYKNFFQKI